jgi:glycerophosphoryl diester phosphodiesterase
VPLWLDNLFLDAVEAAYGLLPEARPTREQWQRLKIISHRGERDGRTTFENCFAAFDPLRGSGVHGIEFDVRWTRDLVPVVIHDADLLRVFGDPLRVGAVTWPELRRQRPEIPGLHGFVRRYVDEFHLMAELKAETYRDPSEQNRRLAEALAPALERDRCHVLCLQPQLFALVPGIPAQRTFGVARLNADEIAGEALKSGRGGFGCHYSALRQRHLAALHARGAAVGCGFPRTRPVLMREAARGVDYVFSNDALRLQRWRQEALAAA